MFDVPLASRRRPMFGVSAALHAALALALAVPPLFAAPEPPEPEVRMPPFLPVVTVHIGDAPAHAREDLLRKGNEGRAPASAGRTSGAVAPLPAPIPPKGIGQVLPEPTGADDGTFTFEEPGAQGAPGSGLPGGTGVFGRGDVAGCEGCSPISATAIGVIPPVALLTPSPSYPELARHAHVEGVVVLEAVIGADGFVRDARILKSANVLLEASALDAVRRWRYRAATVEGRSVPVYLTVVVTFSLK
jgi:periplasmic protein TonB